MTMAWIAKSNNREIDLAVAAWTGAHAYLRPGELVRLLWRWMVPGARSDRSRVSLFLHPSEVSRSSKTGEFDKTAIVDDHVLCEL